MAVAASSGTSKIHPIKLRQASHQPWQKLLLGPLIPKIFIILNRRLNTQNHYDSAPFALISLHKFSATEVRQSEPGLSTNISSLKHVHSVK